ncbi:MAG: methylated-DNA--[protein]-cysteine S-methyltransferase [Planctomycetota bacterium]|nr:methylated-DNA--[protein]-cysteine S-methyltransferase [Planctomycetota bacterium]
MSGSHYFHHQRICLDGIDLGFGAVWVGDQIVATSLSPDEDRARHHCQYHAGVPNLQQAPFPEPLEQDITAALAGHSVLWQFGISPRIGTPFQRQVWHQMEQIVVGTTLEYGQLARRLQRPGAARAVGNACGKNPLPLRIPCHRVVRAGGQLGGFSGDLRVKALLLARESPLSKHDLST